MKRAIWCTTLLAVLFTSSSRAQDPVDTPPPQSPLAELDPVAVNSHIGGRIVDYTHNHGVDRRMWSRSLYQWRDLYVYLPPGYSKNNAYPVALFLHGFAQDETSFLHLVRAVDAAILRGILPPVIIAAPDGSLDGHGCLEKPGSFWINSNAGYYEDFLLQDVWDFLIHHYTIRPEREAHVLIGASMGGFGAFNLGMRHRNAFGAVVGIFPPLNVRWSDCNGNSHANFTPYSWGWRENFDNPHEIIGRFGLIPIRMRHIIQPVFGEGEEAQQMIAANNPIELIDRTRLQNGELAMFIAYGGKDSFNIDAQVESFLYYCKCKGLGVHVAYDPRGHHNWLTASRFLPSIFRWLGPRLAPYAPPLAGVPMGPEAIPADIPIEEQPTELTSAVLRKKQ
jgi:S-formylglutathione hydrolase FrmB